MAINLEMQDHACCFDLCPYWRIFRADCKDNQKMVCLADEIPSYSRVLLRRDNKEKIGNQYMY